MYSALLGFLLSSSSFGDLLMLFPAVAHRFSLQCSIFMERTSRYLSTYYWWNFWIVSRLKLMWIQVSSAIWKHSFFPPEAKMHKVQEFIYTKLALTVSDKVKSGLSLNLKLWSCSCCKKNKMSVNVLKIYFWPTCTPSLSDFYFNLLKRLISPKAKDWSGNSVHSVPSVHTGELSLIPHTLSAYDSEKPLGYLWN